MTVPAAPLPDGRAPPSRAPRRWPWAGLSVALHLGILGALLFWPTGRTPPPPNDDALGVSLVFAESDTEAPVEGQEGMVTPAVPDSPPPVPDQPEPEASETQMAEAPPEPPPPTPQVEAPPRPDTPPPPPPQVEAPPRADAPPPPPVEAPQPPRAVATEEPPSPPPPPIAENLPTASQHAELPPPPPQAPAEIPERRPAMPRVFQFDLEEEPPAWERFAALPRVIEPELVDPPPPQEAPREPPPPEPRPEPPRPRAPARAAPPQRQGRPGQQQAAAAPPSPPIPGPAQPLVLGGGIATGAVVPPSVDPGVNNRPPAYPEASRRAGEQGVVAVTVTVGPDGRVTDVRVAQSSGFPALDEAALMAVAQWRFRPGSRDGTPVTASIRTAVHFRLQSAGR